MTPKTTQELQVELDLLQRELDDCTRLVNSIEQLGHNMEALTRANILGNATASELLAAQTAWEKATAACSRQVMLRNSVREQQMAVDYAKAAEKRAFLDKIGKDFIETRERYIIESKKLLDIFKEMARLNNLSTSMHSHQLLFENDWRLDLPALRREADSPLFTIGYMVRTGAL